ncbi:MAG: iron-containing alcohol dehydrogenase [Candidatus Kapabacteria bacterium]|nr:iron-containing alcohol dehydrogenase [Candidatus Kapabacteria bacterium]
MDNFKFHNPVKIIFGQDTIREIGSEIDSYGISKVLILMGSGSVKKNGVYEQVTDSLEKFGIDYVEQWGVTPNPVLSHAEESLEIARKEQVQAILAVGGGSVIDEAKAIAAAYYAPDIWSLFEKTYKATNALPLFTVLTLSATASEINSFFVLTNDRENKKWSCGSPHVYPKVSIIDPTVQKHLPINQTINGGVDTLSHIMEFYFMGENEESTLSINEALMRTVIKSVDELVSDPLNYDWRANLAWCSSLALQGITSVSMGGGEFACHRIEHAISALYPTVAHAEGLSVLFPAWIEYVSSLKPHIFERWAKNVWEVDSVAAGIEKMKEKFKYWGAPVSLSELDIEPDEFEKIAENALLIGEVGKIKEFNKQDIINILNIAQ